jgi:hypothetical protein
MMFFLGKQSSSQPTHTHGPTTTKQLQRADSAAAGWRPPPFRQLDDPLHPWDGSCTPPRGPPREKTTPFYQLPPARASLVGQSSIVHRASAGRHCTMSKAPVPHRDPAVNELPACPVTKAYRNSAFLNSSHARHIRSACAPRQSAKAPRQSAKARPTAKGELCAHRSLVRVRGDDAASARRPCPRDRHVFRLRALQGLRPASQGRGKGTGAARGGRGR